MSSFVPTNQINNSSDDVSEKSIKSIKCKCGECKDFNLKDIDDHLTNMYSQLNEQSMLIQNQNQTITTILKELIPLLKDLDAKTQQTNGLLQKIEMYNKI